MKRFLATYRRSFWRAAPYGMGIGVSLYIMGMALGVQTPVEQCVARIEGAERRIRNDTWRSNAALTRIEMALLDANATARNKLGVLIRRLEQLSQHERGLDTAWRTETRPAQDDGPGSAAR